VQADRHINKRDMFVRSTLAVLLVTMTGCWPAADPPFAWYALSPAPNSFFPQGDSSSSISTWEQVKVFPTFEGCEDSLKEIQNQINREVGCFPSNDPRLKNLKPASLPEPSPAPSAGAPAPPPKRSSRTS
jgi:hypothetical protein